MGTSWHCGHSLVLPGTAHLRDHTGLFFFHLGLPYHYTCLPSHICIFKQPCPCLSGTKHNRCSTSAHGMYNDPFRGGWYTVGNTQWLPFTLMSWLVCPGLKDLQGCRQAIHSLWLPHWASAKSQCLACGHFRAEPSAGL